MSQLDKPIVSIPLAASYNSRTFAVTATKDQRKINSFYQPVTNPLTGKNTLYLCKRPSVGDTGSIFSASAGDVPYLIIGVSTGDLAANTWGVFRDASDVTKVINTASSNTVVTDANRRPIYIDKTLISGTETVVLQLRHTSGDLAAIQKVYFSSAIGTWTEITDADFTANKPHGKMEFMDGYAFYLNSDNKVYNSDLNSLANWTATSYITKQIQQDRPMGLMQLGRILLACGSGTMEGFYNAGNTAGSPLGRIPHLSQRVGLAYQAQNSTAGTRHYYTRLLNKLFFLGNVEVSSGGAASVGVYSFDGSSVTKVSNAAIDSKLSNGVVAASWHVCTISFYGRAGIAIAYSAITNATQTWLVYFPDWNEWFEWESTYAQFANSGAYFLGIGGTASYRDIGQFGSSPGIDGDSNAYTMTHQFKLPSQGNHRKFMPVCGVVGDTQTSASTLSVEFSDDDYATFSTARTIDLTSQKKQLYRCGSYLDRAVRLTHSANTDCRLEAFVAKVTDK